MTKWQPTAVNWRSVWLGPEGSLGPKLIHVVFGDVVDLAGRGDSESSEMDTRRMVRFPDSHQLFVGNLPHDIDESELKDFFMSMFHTEEPLSKQYEGPPLVSPMSEVQPPWYRARCPWSVPNNDKQSCYLTLNVVSLSLAPTLSCSLWECCWTQDQHEGSWRKAAQLWICGLWWLWSCAENSGGQGSWGMCMYRHFLIDFYWSRLGQVHVYSWRTGIHIGVGHTNTNWYR